MMELAMMLMLVAMMGSSDAVSDADKQVIVDAHNNYRSGVSPTASDMVKMIWDDELAKAMQTHIDMCTDEHNDVDIPGWGMAIGQNLASGQADWQSVVDGWYSEVSSWQYGVGSTDNEDVGHYTQVVQGVAARVGCAHASCSTNHYGCNYAYGQLTGTYGTPYTSGTSCSKCPSVCNNKLCDCGGKICKNGGTLDVSTCQCACAGVWTGDDCSSQNCPTTDGPYCGTPGGYDLNGCELYTNVPEECPLMCGVCP